MVGATALVDQGFNPLVESYQKTLKNGIHSFPTWRSTFREDVENKQTSLLFVSLGKALTGMLPPLCARQVAQATPKRVRTSCPKYSDTIRFLVNGG